MIKYKSMVHLRCDGETHWVPIAAPKEEVKEAVLERYYERGDFLCLTTSGGRVLHFNKSMISFWLVEDLKEETPFN